MRGGTGRRSIEFRREPAGGPDAKKGVGVPAGDQSNSAASRPVGPTLKKGVGVPAGDQSNSAASRPVGPTLKNAGGKDAQRIEDIFACAGRRCACAPRVRTGAHGKDAG